MEKEVGVTVYDVLNVVKKRIIWIVSVATAIFIAATLVTVFVYNRNGVEYTYGFEIVSSDLAGGKYPDGTIFYYGDLVSETALLKVRDSDERFSSIDVEKMARQGDIYLSYHQPDSTKETLAPNGDDVNEDKWYRTVTVKGKYFESKAQAAAFLRAALELPVKQSLSLAENVNYETDLDAFDACRTTYAEKIGYLRSQANANVAVYDSLIDLYGPDYYVSGFRDTLAGCRLSAKSVFTAADYNHLVGDADANYFVPRSTEDYNRFFYDAQNAVKIKKRQKEDNLRLIEELEKNVAVVTLAGEDIPSDAYSRKIAELKTENAAIDVEIGRLLGQTGQLLCEKRTDVRSEVWQEEFALYNALRMDCYGKQITEAELVLLYGKDRTTFRENLAYFRDVLHKEAEKAKSIKVSVDSKETFVRFKSAEPVVSGVVNSYLVMALSFFGGFLLASVVFCCIDLPKVMRKRAAEKSVLSENGEVGTVINAVVNFRDGHTTGSDSEK